VLERRLIPSSEQREVKLSLPNTFGARERAFITKLADDFHLELSWDEYDEEDQNLAVLQFPGAFEPPSDEKVSESGSQGGVDTTAAVDCALRKYDEAKILMETLDDNFDSREGDKLKQKMDDWKRAYYAVRGLAHSLDVLPDYPSRVNSRYHMMIPMRCANWSFVILRACSG
jgi:5'-3' exoribonuclease 1